MLIVSAQNQQGVFEKVLRGKDGRLYAVRFVVTETEGQVRARVISASPVQTLKGGCAEQNRSCNLLQGDCSVPEDFFEITENEYLSPFVSELDFLVNQLARAPSASF